MRISDWSSDVCSSDLDMADTGLDYVIATAYDFLDDVPRVIDDVGIVPHPPFKDIGACTPVERVASGIANQQIIRAGTARSDERRVGKECASTCRSRWAQYD